MAKINLPQQLVRFVDGEIVEIDAPTVGEFFAEFIKRYPTLEQRLIKQDGSFNVFVNIYVNDEDIRFLNGKNTALKKTDEITVVPSTAGG
jgi:molybdopterin synthase sulfur carrier subunit